MSKANKSFLILALFFLCLPMGFGQSVGISANDIKKDLAEGNYQDLMKYHDYHLAELKRDGNNLHLAQFYNLLSLWENLEGLEKWAKAEPNNFVAWTAVGHACLEKGAQYRGIYSIQHVSAENLKTFGEYLERARPYLDYAVRLGPDDPYPYDDLMQIGMHQGWDHARMLVYFQKAMQLAPQCQDAIWHMGLHYSPLWQGTAGEMRRFTDQYCLTAPKGNYLRLFVVRCYEDIWYSRGARNSYWGNTPAWTECKQEFEDYLAVHPEDLSTRGWYSFLAYCGRHYWEAKEQFDVLGDRWNANSFHWVVQKDYMKAKENAARRANDPDQGQF